MSEPLAEARVIIVPDLTKFSAELKTQLAAQIKAVEGSTVALAGKAKATSAVTTADKQLAGAELSTAAATKAKAAADRAAAKAAAEHAAAMEQLRRGAGSTGLSLLNVRGATLAAGSQFLIGAAAVTVLAKAVKGAIEDQETLFGVSKVLGPALGQQLASNATKLADSYGIADQAALKFEGALAATLQNAGVASKQNAELAESFVKLAADLAAVRHVPVEDTLKAIQLAVSGNTRSLRQYGIVIQNAEVQQRALARTGKDTVAQLTKQELTAARISLIFDRASFAAGGFAENQGSLANQSKILSANLDELGDTLGALVIKGLGPVAKRAIETADAIERLIKFAKDTSPPVKDAEGNTTRWGKALHDLGVIFGKSLFQLDDVARLTLPAWNKETRDAASGTDLFANATAGLGGAVTLIDGQIVHLGVGLAAIAPAAGEAGSGIDGLIGPMSLATQAAIRLQQELTGIVTASHQLLDLQFQGASSAAQIAALQTIIDNAQAVIAHPGRTGAAGRERARTERNQAQSQIDAIIAKDKADAEAAANKAKAAAAKAKADAERAAREAQARLDAQDQALLAEQSFQQGLVELRKLRAQRTKSLVDDIAADRIDLALTKQQIVDAQKIHDAELRRNTILTLQTRAEQDRQDILAKQQEQRDRRRQRLTDRADAKVQLAQLDAQIAETRGQKNAEIAALRRANIALEEKRKLWVGNTLKQRQITLAIAENTKQINELKKKQQENTGASAAFLFLQAQQGFAANLLGNLLSGAVTAGTVGGTSGAISTPTITGGGGGGSFGVVDFSPFGLGTDAQDRRNVGTDVSAAARVNAGVRGASSSQMSVLIGIQKNMLNAIRGTSAKTSHPEAARAWAWTATEMLNTGW